MSVEEEIKELNEEMLKACRLALADLYTYHPLFKQATSIARLEKIVTEANRKLEKGKNNGI